MIRKLKLAHALNTVECHPTNHKELLISDRCGSLFIVDWTIDNNALASAPRVVAEFIDPKAIAQHRLGLNPWSGCASWNLNDVNIIAAVYGDRWSVWEQGRGEKPLSTGASFDGGSICMRWCPTDSKLFTIAPLRSAYGAVLHIHNLGFINSTPHSILIKPSPHRISDLDWLVSSTQTQPRIAVGVGPVVIIGNIAEVN